MTRRRAIHKKNCRNGVCVVKLSFWLFVGGAALTLLLAEGLGIVVGLYVSVLLSGGLGFTVHEFKRLSAEGEAGGRAEFKILPFRHADRRKNVVHSWFEKVFSQPDSFPHTQAASGLR
jgi:hypothetical protein